jgi:hypothetical protein
MGILRWLERLSVKAGESRCFGVGPLRTSAGRMAYWVFAAGKDAIMTTMDALTKWLKQYRERRNSQARTGPKLIINATTRRWGCQTK